MLRLSCCPSSQFNRRMCPIHSKTRPTCGGRKAQKVVLLGFHWSTSPRERVKRCGASSFVDNKAENEEEDLSCCCDRVKSTSLLCTVHKRSNMINEKAHKDQDLDNDQNQYQDQDQGLSHLAQKANICRQPAVL